MTRTTRERRTHTNYGHQALLALGAAELTQDAYQARRARAIAEHGDLPAGKTHVSAIYAEHFPEQTKIELRALAYAIGPWRDIAIALWRKSGRRIDTLRPMLREGIPS